MHITDFLLLSSLGLALTVQAQNCSKPVVTKPNMNLRDQYILQDTFQDGAKVYFACNVGYMAAGGSTAITCTAGTWSDVMLKCERKNCGSAGEVAYGEIDYPQGTEFGDKAVVTCDTGYTLVGKKEILCGDKGWMDRLPSCEVVKCLSAPDVSDATYYPIKEAYEYGDVVQYTCARGFTLNGSKSLSCEGEGKFTPEPPQCIKVECEDPQIPNAIWESGSRPPHKHLSTVTFRCRDKYVMKGQGSLTCNINSKWSPGLPTCEPKNCSTPVPGPHMKLKDTLLKIFPHGTTVSFTCDVGYMSAGGSTDTSCSTGDWSPVTLKCQRKNCGSAGTVRNGVIDYPQGTLFGDKAVIRCEKGYTLEGNREITCGDEGWMNSLPVCKVVKCVPPHAVVHGVFRPNKREYVYGDVVEYSCDKSYTMEGLQRVQCSEDGTFKPGHPTCRMITCNDPVIINGNWEGTSPHQHSSMVTITCKPGYILKGEETQTCDDNGEWTPGLPICESDGIGKVNLPAILVSVIVPLGVVFVGLLIFYCCSKKEKGRSKKDLSDQKKEEHLPLS